MSNWLGHVLRRKSENDCMTALEWTPAGNRRQIEKNRREGAEQGRVDELGWGGWSDSVTA